MNLKRIRSLGFKSNSGKDVFFYGSLSLLIILLAQVPVVLHLLHTPKGFYYPYLDQVSQSDFYYIALVRYGMGEEWMTKVPYVITEHKATIIQILFIWLGKMSKLTGIGPAEVLALARIAGGIFLITSAVYFFRLVLPRILSKIAFVIFLFVQPLPSLTTSILNEGYNLWVWHFGEAARRISLMPPHYSIGKGAAIFSLYFLFSYLENPSRLKLALMLFTGVFSGIIYPPPNLIIPFSMGATFMVFWVFKRFKVGRIKITQLSGFGTYFLANLIPLILLKLELNKGYPWNMWNKVELGWNNSNMRFEWGYFRMYWLLFLFLPLFIFVLRKSKEKMFHLFLLIWGVSAFILFPFANQFNLGKFRFTEGIQLIPLSIITALVLSNFTKIAQYVFFVLFFAYFSLFGVLVFKDEVLRLWPYWSNVYFPPENIASFEFLRRQVKPDSVVIADIYSSNYIPAMARLRVPLGFSDFYPDYNYYKRDLDTAVSIMQNKIPLKEAHSYLNNQKAEYLYVDKSVFGDLNLYPELLTEVFNNTKIKIYKVKN